MRITRHTGSADKVLGIFLREFSKEIKALRGELQILSHRNAVQLQNGYSLGVDMDLDIARVHREATVAQELAGHVTIYPLDLEAADPTNYIWAIEKKKTFRCGQERKAAHFLAHVLRITKQTR